MYADRKTAFQHSQQQQWQESCYYNWWLVVLSVLVLFVLFLFSTSCILSCFSFLEGRVYVKVSKVSQFHLMITLGHQGQSQHCFIWWAICYFSTMHWKILIESKSHEMSLFSVYWCTFVSSDTNNLCELIAFDILHPVPILHSYLRLVS